MVFPLWVKPSILPHIIQSETMLSCRCVTAWFWLPGFAHELCVLRGEEGKEEERMRGKERRG
jgi:hypothetical protein